VLLRFQPVAADLRQVVSAMKLSSNIERIADQAVNIARRARKLNRDPRLNEAAMVEPMYHHAFAMFHDAIDAYVRSDTVMARGMKTRDRELDEMNRHLSKELTECMSKDTPRLEGYLALLFIGRHLERVGDHATNMAEDAVFAVAAEDIRHNGASRLSSGTT
jgi:phosphate transport system protein